MSSTYAPDTLDDPQFIPGENIGTGHGGPILKTPAPPGETLRVFWELIGQTFDSVPWIGFLFLVAIMMTVALVAFGLSAVMSTIRMQKMIGDQGRNDTELIAAYLARNKKANEQTADYEDDHDQQAQDWRSVSSRL